MKFSIPTEYCLIVSAFSQASTLRGAALLLGMDPAALVRKVQRISSDFGYLQKIGNRWTVTEAGRRVAYWTEDFLNSQKSLVDETPRLRISAYSWLTEEILIPNFRTLDASFKSQYTWSFRMTGTDLEQDLIHNRADFVVHGRAPNDPAVAHRKIASYSWVAVAPFSWKSKFSNLSQTQLIEFLHTKKFCRHADLNPTTVLSFLPKNIHDLVVDGVIGLRSAVINELGWSALPAMSIQTAIKEKKIVKLNLPIQYKDDLSIWWMRSRRDITAYSKHLIHWISKLEIQ